MSRDRFSAGSSWWLARTVTGLALAASVSLTALGADRMVLAEGFTSTG